MLRKLAQFSVVASLLAWPQHPLAQMVNENILADMPEGYKVASQKRQNGITQVEMIPQDQTLENWQEMFIVRIFHNSPLSLEAIEKQTASRWFAACPAAAYKSDHRGIENGYDISFFFLICPNLQKSGKPMSRMVKALRGRDSLYLTQAVFKRPLTRDIVEEWTPFMTKIGLCDTRDETRACPPGL
ncbi:MAG: hypothetical protein WBC71_03700 [Salaquimonas sp.]